VTAGRPARPWEVVERRGPAAELHARPLDASGRRVEVLGWLRPALVLGSTQPWSDAEPAAADRLGADVVRRRSGGGAVLLRPGHDLWVDVTIPRDDPLWEDDVAVSFHWLGRAWVAALAGLGIEADVHLGPSVNGPWSKRVCFAGLGPGEVTVPGGPGGGGDGDGDGRRKAVGISQRRTREGARFQCLALGSWDVAALLDLLALDAAARAEGAAALAGAAAGLARPPATLAAALVAVLMRSSG
jgi:lipoate-protein ligase A